MIGNLQYIPKCKRINTNKKIIFHRFTFAKIISKKIIQLWKACDTRKFHRKSEKNVRNLSTDKSSSFRRNKKKKKSRG